jgi:hypothetical protein
MRRTLLAILGLFFACAISLTAPRPASAELGCPYEHLLCPDPSLYDCCCLKGVRCDLNEDMCERWCNGELY